MNTPLKIAIPNKGSLSEPAIALMREAGYRQRSDSKELMLADRTNSVEFYYLRPRDIAIYVGEGTVDVGITGRDLLLDSGAHAEEIMALGFGASQFRFAAPADRVASLEQLAGARIATSYPVLLQNYLDQQGISARLITLDGAVEGAIRLGVADAIADVVDTGATLRKAGLGLFGAPILESEAILVKQPHTANSAGVDRLVAHLSGVMVARDYVLLDYDVSDELLGAATEITPGLEGPTVSPLAKDGWFAVRALVPRAAAHQLMDDLWELGARAILVTELAACRL